MNDEHPEGVSELLGAVNTALAAISKDLRSLVELQHLRQEERSQSSQRPKKRHAVDSTSTNERVGRAFKLHLDREGYSFHHAVLRRCREIATQPSDHQLTFEVSEFPVQTRGRDSRVDFILRSKSHWQNPPPLMLVCECKRSNPAFADWCFARAPYVRRNRVIVDALTFGPDNQLLATSVSPSSIEAPYHLGLPVKNDETGDPTAKGNAREAIEEAAGQAMRAVNGLTDFLSTNPQVLHNRQVLLIPVIFTTAVLYTSDVRLDEATIETGMLPTDHVDIQSREWLWFQFLLHRVCGIRSIVGIVLKR